jgi:hypothetical protein
MRLWRFERKSAIQSRTGRGPALYLYVLRAVGSEYVLASRRKGLYYIYTARATEAYGPQRTSPSSHTFLENVPDCAGNFDPLCGVITEAERKPQVGASPQAPTQQLRVLLSFPTAPFRRLRPGGNKRIVADKSPEVGDGC